MNAHTQIARPNADVISEFLYILFPPDFVHAFPDAWIDITCIRPDKTLRASFFSAHDLKPAIDHVVKMNTAGWNCYVGAALRHGQKPKEGERSGKKHFCAASHFWVDLDGAGDYERAVAVCKRERVDVAMLHITGTDPHKRSQIWIKSALPVTNIAELEEANVILRDVLGGDKVQNADRIMRIAGTVNLPPPHKVEKGYKVELTTMATNSRPSKYSSTALCKLRPATLGTRDVTGSSDRGKSFADADGYQRFADKQTGEAGRLTDADMHVLLSKHPNGTGDGWHNDLLAVTHELLCRGYEPFAIQMVVGSACRMGWSDPDIGKLIYKKWDAIQAAKQEAEREERAKASAQQKPVDPVDLWGKFEPPTLPRGLLPDVLERFAFDQGTDMGADISGVAMSVLAVCAAAIPDHVRLQVKRHNTRWLEAARLWVALVGPPSTKKTPIMAASARPLRRIDADQARSYAEQRTFYERLPKEEKALTEPPKQIRSVIQDTTIEAAQEILKDSPHGVLCYQDELSGWFGAMDKYSAGRGSAKDRSFWLEAFNGGQYSVQRVGRGSVYIENLSISLVGGIQSEPMRRIADESVDDGLLQRLLPITLRPAIAGRDEQPSSVVAEYEELIGRLNVLGPTLLRFDDGAQRYRQELEAKHLRLTSLEFVHRKLAAHIGKYDGIFARLCVIWHCVENAPVLGDMSATTISEATARRVGAFLHGFILPHAIGFYVGVLGLSNDHDSVAAVAGYILTRKLEKITNRDLKRGDQTMRRLKPDEALAVFEQLQALGWLDRKASPRSGKPDHWVVNPAVHEKFAERAKVETERRAEVRQMIAEAVGRKVEA